MLQTIYNLKNDFEKLRRIQEVSLDKSSKFGLKAKNNFIFGSDKWFEAIKNGEIEQHSIKGKILKVYMSGHNDYPEFEIESEDGKSIWTREGIDSAYKVGRESEVIYVEQNLKNGLPSKCVVRINVDL